jgi:hypothetical protein
MNGMNATTNVLHVRCDGRSLDVPLTELELDGASSEREIKQRVAGLLEIEPARLRDHVVDRHANGNLTLRPQAVFG